MSIDYLPDEMAKAADHYGVNRQISEFYLGWRAACEAWHARAQAKAAPGHIIDDQGNVRKVNGRLVVNQSGEVVGHNAVIWVASKRLLNGQAGVIRNECDWLFKSHSNRVDAINEAAIRLNHELSIKEALTVMAENVKQSPGPSLISGMKALRDRLARGDNK
jgi:hypothetical protein